jgi:hypothetical protein
VSDSYPSSIGRCPGLGISLLLLLNERKGSIYLNFQLKKKKGKHLLELSIEEEERELECDFICLKHAV